MVDSYDEVLMSFKFNFYDDHDSKQKIEIVYSKDVNTMELFLRQHNFLKNNQPIEEFFRMNLFQYDSVWNYYIEEVGLIEEIVDYYDDYSTSSDKIPNCIQGRILKRFRFRSNEHSDEIVIISNDQLVLKAIELTCQLLTDSLIFGNMCLKDEVDFVKLILEGIDSLPKVQVLDYSLMDSGPLEDDYGEYDGKDKEINEKKREYYESQINIPLTKNVFVDSLLEDIPQGRFHDTGCYYVYKAMMDDSYTELVQPITIEAYVNNFSKCMK